MKCHVRFLFVLFFATVISSCTDEKPKILIIGDSISLGYTPFVKANFADKAIIEHNPGNAQHTGTGLQKIKEWIGDGEWDIVQFNWGLWDLCYRHPDSKVQGNRDKVNGKVTFSVEDYSANLDSIVAMLKERSDAKLIFVTTSYVPEKEAGRFSDDALKYNEAAKKIMEKHGVEVNDIFKKSAMIHSKFGSGQDNVHYTEEGYKALGETISNFLLKKIE